MRDYIVIAYKCCVLIVTCVMFIFRLYFLCRYYSLYMYFTASLRHHSTWQEIWHEVHKPIADIGRPYLIVWRFGEGEVAMVYYCLKPDLVIRWQAKLTECGPAQNELVEAMRHSLSEAFVAHLKLSIVSQYYIRGLECIILIT